MTESIYTYKQRGPTGKDPSDNDEGHTLPTRSFTTITINWNITSVKEATRSHPFQDPELARKDHLPFVMQRYLEEDPEDSGPTYGLVYDARRRHDDTLNIFALVDFEFREEKTSK